MQKYHDEIPYEIVNKRVIGGRSNSNLKSVSLCLLLFRWYSVPKRLSGFSQKKRESCITK